MVSVEASDTGFVSAPRRQFSMPTTRAYNRSPEPLRLR